MCRSYLESLFFLMWTRFVKPVLSCAKPSLFGIAQAGPFYSSGCFPLQRKTLCYSPFQIFTTLAAARVAEQVGQLEQLKHLERLEQLADRCD